MKGQGRNGDDIFDKQIKHSCHFSLKSAHSELPTPFDAVVDFSLMDKHPKLEKNLSRRSSQ